MNDLVFYQSPVGVLEIEASATSLYRLEFSKQPLSNTKTENLIIKETVLQLDEYFGGKRTVFNLPLELTGTEFQKTVWQQLQRIPYGTTISYKQLAVWCGNEKLTRAVGNANNKNPIVIVVPCHRVIGITGKLVGFGGGLPNKQWLLQFESQQKSIF